MNLQAITQLAKYLRFPNPELAAAIAMAESGGDPCAVGDQGTSFGLWQINETAHPEYIAREMVNPVICGQAAYAISSAGQNWQPWTTYRTGAYKKWYTPPPGEPTP